MGCSVRSRTFTIHGQSQRDAAVAFIDELHDAEAANGKKVEVSVGLAEEGRRSAQNRLNWLWCGQIAQSQGVSPDYAHGWCKLDVGLPMQLADEKLHKRAAFVAEVLAHVPERKHKIAVVYDMLRSSDLSVKQFADYLTAVDQHFAAQGIVLLSPDDLRVTALMERRAA